MSQGKNLEPCKCSDAGENLSPRGLRAGSLDSCDVSQKWKERKKKKKQIKPKESREIINGQGKKEGGLLSGNDKAEGILEGGPLSVARSEPWSQISGNKVPYFEDITHKSVILRVQ